VITGVVGIALPAALIIAAGSSWVLGSTGSSASSGAAVSTSAVVVSSLACRNGDEGTVVDLRNPAGTTRRATMDSCGHRPGEEVTVQYSTADPGRVVLAAVADGEDDPSGRLLPLGLMLAALLGVAAVTAVVRDARRSAGADEAVVAPGARHGRHARVDEDEPPPPVAPPVEPAVRASDLDLLFPAQESLRSNLHDEVFTHRSTAGV
jgi:hypothetical protein